MKTSDGQPDAEWFRQMANGSAVVFFVLRVHPDAAFEFLTDAVETQIGCPAAEGLADPAAVLGLIDPEYATNSPPCSPSPLARRRRRR